MFFSLSVFKTFFSLNVFKTFFSLTVFKTFFSAASSFATLSASSVRLPISKCCNSFDDRWPTSSLAATTSNRWIEIDESCRKSPTSRPTSVGRSRRRRRKEPSARKSNQRSKTIRQNLSSSRFVLFLKCSFKKRRVDWIFLVQFEKSFFHKRALQS